MWFVVQLLNGVISLGVDSGATGGVAFIAHVAGFVAGLVMTWFFMKLVHQPPTEQRREVLYQRARRYRY
jgi:membrane associated rhomboid family serine protease